MKRGWTIAGAALALAVLAGGAQAQQAAAPDTAWQQEYRSVLAAAEKEGKVAVIGRPGDDRDAFFRKFQDKFPGIKIEYNLMRPSNVSPRVLAEQQKGVYLWDVMVEGGSNVATVMKPAGAIADMHDYLIRDPLVVGNAKWHGGFEDGFRLSDNIGMYTFGVSTAVGPWINRQYVTRQEVGSLKDLLDPKWKGKIVINDPNVPAHGQIMLAAMAYLEGEQFVRKLMIDQQPVYVTDVRQMTQWLATGRYPIAIGADNAVIDNLKSKGVGKQVELLVDGGLPRTLSGVTVNVFKNAPHPNATKIFLHWLLSQEGQKAFSDIVGETNSRRVDVGAAEPMGAPDWSRLGDYTFSLQQKVGLDALNLVSRIARDTKK